MPDGDRGDDAEDVERILDAAWEALRRAGYENLKVKWVIRRAGVSVGSFYRRFSGKDDLLLALMREEARRNTRVLDAVTREGTPTDRVVAWVSTMVGIAFDERARARTRWFLSTPPDVRRRHAQLAYKDPEVDINEPLRRAVRDGIESGEFPAAHPDHDAAAIGALCGGIGAGDTTRFGDTKEDVIAAIVTFVLAALTNPQPRTMPTRTGQASSA